ncbi:SMC-Scp complex subunit ScpB [Oscillospiraceae bacterium MB08-C2-2]|nr:SMC-Scp complex subunit ScpB [Oscillospiraceae bacterium MB08-C2-2]
MQIERMERNVEAILFAAGDPLEGEKIALALDIEEKTVKNLVNRIADRYDREESPFDIVFMDGAYQLCTRPDFAPVIRAALEIRRSAPLSQAALEVLAIVAYNQPVTRAFVDQVRGVDCSSVMRSLVEKGLIMEAGRLQIPGKPLAYKTTPNFLRSFGMESLEQLPTVPSLPDEEPEDEAQLPGQIDFFEIE